MKESFGWDLGKGVPPVILTRAQVALSGQSQGGEAKLSVGGLEPQDQGPQVQVQVIKCAVRHRCCALRDVESQEPYEYSRSDADDGAQAELHVRSAAVLLPGLAASPVALVRKS